MDIRPRPPSIEDPQSVDTRRSLADEQERRTGRNHTSLGEMRSNDFELGRELADEREQAFTRRLTQALGNEEASTEVAPDAPLRVLAVAGQSLPVAGLMAGTRPETAVEGGRLDTIIDRVERAMTARGIEGLPGTVSLRLDLGDLGGSVGGMTISLAPGSIDLVLSRAGETADAPFLQAAQALADRLHARFPKRVVRVLEAEPQPSAPAHGLAAFSRLLDPSGDAS